MVRAILIPLIPILLIALVVFFGARSGGGDKMASKRQLAKRIALQQEALHRIELEVNNDIDIHGRLPIHTNVLDTIRKHNITMTKEIAK